LVLSPVKWLVQAIAWLPDLLRPGVFVAILFWVLWFVFVRRGVPRLWHAAWRGTARLVGMFVGVVVLPEYMVTASRRKRGESPAEFALVMGQAADWVLNGAADLYERHRCEPVADGKLPRKFPWKSGAAVVILCAGAWLVMDQLPAGSDAKHELSQAFDRWRDVEAWAGVDPTRRAAPGEAEAFRVGTPVVRRTRVHGRDVTVTLHCASATACHGRLVLVTRSGERLYSRPVALRPGGIKKVTRRFPGGMRQRLRHVRASIHG
jgi:hypothetical protein